MRGSVCAALLLGSSACLSRVQVGGVGLPDAGCEQVPCDDSGDDSQYEDLLGMAEQLSSTGWVGDASTGPTTVPCRFTFTLDGTYTVTDLGTDPRAFWDLFPLNEDGLLEGRYRLTDHLQDEYFGVFEDPLASWELSSDIAHLTLRDGRLEFERRFLAWDYAAVTRVVLKPEP